MGGYPSVLVGSVSVCHFKINEQTYSRPRLRESTYHLGQHLVNSSTDEEEVFADSESNASLSDGDSSLAPQTDELVILKCGDFVIANVHTAAGNCKKFIGKLVSGPDEDKDFKISFLERSRKIKNEFLFPEMEDLASIGKKILKKFCPHLMQLLKLNGYVG